MAASAWTIASRAVDRAGRGTATITGTPDHQRAELDAGGGRELVITIATPGHPRLDDGTSQVILPDDDAVRTAAAWIDGTPLASRPADPPAYADASRVPAVAELWARVAAAVTDALPDGLAADDEPVGIGDAEGVYRLAGPHGARLTVTPRLTPSGELTEVSWRGTLATGAATYGHGTPEAAARAAAKWAATLTSAPAITPAGIRARREALGLSQPELANHLGVGQSTLAQWEASSRAPRDPASIDDAIAALEDQAAVIVQRQLATADQTSPGQPAALTTTAGPGLDDALHRVATGRAAATLRNAGRAVVVTYTEK